MSFQSLASLPQTGLYGTPGWIEERGIIDVLSPFVDSSAVDTDFIRFSGVDGSVVQKLRPLLPVENLNDRQNNAPPLDVFVQAAVTNPHILLGGYLVLSPRWDERISIDSVYIEDSSARDYQDSPWALIYEDGVWERLQERLGFDGYCRPDECEPIACMDEAHGPGWWLWWD